MIENKCVGLSFFGTMVMDEESINKMPGCPVCGHKLYRSTVDKGERECFNCGEFYKDKDAVIEKVRR